MNVGVGIPTPILRLPPCMCPDHFCHAGDVSISVFLADDNLLVREGVKALIEFAGDFDIVGMAEGLRRTRRGSNRNQPAGGRNRHPDAARVRGVKASRPPR